jgi:hypothetical protein
MPEIMLFRMPALLRAAVLLAAILTVAQAGAQGLDNEKAIDTIIGSEVEEQQSRASDETGKIVAAIEKTPEAIDTVRKISKVEKVEIVFLPDAAADGAPAEIDAAAARHESEIAELRKEIEGNAMLFHAIDSRSVMMRDVLAVDFDDTAGVVIYAAARKPD